MRNNRTSLNSGEAVAIMKRLGDPELVSGTFRDLTDDRILSIAQINPGNPDDVKSYEKLYNNPDMYDVIHEESRNAGRESVVVIRYLRDPACEPVNCSGTVPLLKKSRNSRAKPSKKFVGFDAGSAKRK